MCGTLKIARIRQKERRYRYFVCKSRLKCASLVKWFIRLTASVSAWTVTQCISIKRSKKIFPFLHLERPARWYLIYFILVTIITSQKLFLSASTCFYSVILFVMCWLLNYKCLTFTINTREFLGLMTAARLTVVVGQLGFTLYDQVITDLI